MGLNNKNKTKASPFKHLEGGHAPLSRDAHIRAHNGDVVAAGYKPVEENIETAKLDLLKKDFQINPFPAGTTEHSYQNIFEQQEVQDILQPKWVPKNKQEGDEFRRWARHHYPGLTDRDINSKSLYDLDASGEFNNETINEVLNSFD